MVKVKMLGALALLEGLKREGVDVVFGFPGGQVLPLYDCLYGCPEIRHILVRHEQGAVHAADGYARASGKVGVCIATSGPGATNLVTGIANAHMDSIPLVAITGQVPTTAIGKDAFQEADIFGITMPITKHNYLVKDVKDLPQIVREAFYIARTGRPGPVLIDLPKDVTTHEVEYSHLDKVDLPGYKPVGKGHPRMIKRGAEAISRAQRPVILAGGGIISANASAELFKFAEMIDAPVTTTLMGKGGFPDTHPLALGMPGMHGTAYANYALNEADLIIAVGARFDDRVTGKLEKFVPKAQVVHIDIDPAEIGKTVPVAVPIVGDVKLVLADLLKQVKPKKHPAWIATVNKWKKDYPLKYGDHELKPQYVIEQIAAASKSDAICVTDVGQHQMWAAQFFPCNKPRTFLSSGGLGTMGFGLPAAIGAQVAQPDRLVWHIAGDGSIQMNIQELATAVVNHLPVKSAIMNNRYLGMVRQWQELFFDRHYSHTDLDVDTPDFVKLAEAYGAVGIRIMTKDEVRPALRQALKVKDRPCILDFHVAREENVMPMVPAGGSVDEMLID
jgi:acetolactate synthase-1/2/3 large subunit